MIRNLIDKYVPDITIAHNDTHLLINGQDIDLTSVKKQYIIHGKRTLVFVWHNDLIIINVLLA